MVFVLAETLGLEQETLAVDAVDHVASTDESNIPPPDLGRADGEGWRSRFGKDMV